MDDSTFDQLKAALSAAPGNVALLTMLVGASLERGELERGLDLLPADLEQWPNAAALKLAAAQLCLAAGQAPRALQLIEGNDPAARLLKARVLASLERLKEAQVEYRAAVDANPALEDMALWRRLNVSVLDFPAAEGRPRLRVISNDDTDKSEVVRLLVPEKETLTFDDIGGLDELKKTIHKKIILPYQKPGLFQRFRKKVGGGVLLYGPPGCGKTLLARATAGECKATFFNVAISDVLDMYIGESERKLHALFEQARAQAPAVMFFDEVEALGGKRSNTRESTSSKLVSQFLSEMDGFTNDNHGVLILAATNVPWSVDSAFRRPGRFDRVLFVPPPDRPARESMLKAMMKGRPMADDIDFAFLAKNTSGFSGADLSELVETAADEAIEASIESGTEQLICDRHFKAALKDVRATTLEWLTTARNYARYANEGNQYDEVLAFLDKHGKGR
ncbi:ATP-binding protein [Pseudomonas edaphica]|uniref:ATP-binding protein n=1 Tax=Pseudomonas edaphica TaxID=2006980 RepID=A0A7Y7RMN8_9PSED|nr:MULTISPECIES: ATP-binding protein [Pseudomonas]NMX56608.1 ATP-binding protein [Pseudomonas sp. WS 5146]NVZ55019.1 ATP-binding protein [Pseudomonas edaphica]PIB63811.1 cell division protein [Pseudomonas sp. 2995-3]